MAPSTSRPRRVSCVIAGLGLTLLAGSAGAQQSPSANYSPVMRTGTEVMSEWTESVKTDKGKQFRRYEAVYDWDTGMTHRRSYDADGVLVSTRTIARAPTPSPDEIEEAIAIVRDNPDVIEIQRRQTGIQIEGGFIIQQTKAQGPCHTNARCLQIFLFDGENVVRHMLVDLRTNTIVDHDYVPPRNRGVAR